MNDLYHDYRVTPEAVDRLAEALAEHGTGWGGMGRSIRIAGLSERQGYRAFGCLKALLGEQAR